ncbi:MAG: hypothetical protein WBG11_12485 [Methylocella sp.]
MATGIAASVEDRRAGVPDPLTEAMATPTFSDVPSLPEGSAGFSSGAEGGRGMHTMLSGPMSGAGPAGTGENQQGAGAPECR